MGSSELFSEEVKLINQHLKEKLDFDDHGELYLAANYAVFSGGKRIRPLLLLLLLKDLKSKQSALNIACSIELLHCASLVHDDLPALDNDDYRRGVPTCHKQFSEATAILVGDLLVAKSFQVLASSDYKDTIITAATKILAAAFVDLCFGQQLDLDPEARKDLLKIHRLKTGALFKACCLSAGIIAEYTELKEFEHLGENIGEFFQVVDDYLDIYGAYIETGRFSSSDERNQRTTFFTELDPHEALDKVKSYWEKMLLNISSFEAKFSCNLDNTRALLSLIFERIKTK